VVFTNMEQRRSQGCAAIEGGRHPLRVQPPFTSHIGTRHDELKVLGRASSKHFLAGVSALGVRTLSSPEGCVRLLIPASARHISVSKPRALRRKWQAPKRAFVAQALASHSQREIFVLEPDGGLTIVSDVQTPV
jgi:hypothetical protein